MPKSLSANLVWTKFIHFLGAKDVSNEKNCKDMRVLEYMSVDRFIVCVGDFFDTCTMYIIKLFCCFSVQQYQFITY